MKHTIIIIVSILALPIATLALSPSLYAKQSAEDKIKFRQSGYMFMRWNMGIIKNQVIKKPGTYNKHSVIASANVIKSIAHSGIEKLFTPKTSTGIGWKETRVKQEFIVMPNQANKFVTQLKRDTSNLVSAAHTGDISKIKSEFKRVLKTCKGCHKEFRQK